MLVVTSRVSIIAVLHWYWQYCRRFFQYILPKYCNTFEKSTGIGNTFFSIGY